MKTHAVSIRKEWPEKEIHINVVRTDEGLKEISVVMSLSEFLDALAIEAGSPLLWFTQTQLTGRLKEAAQVTVDKMKSETRRVM